MQVGPPFTLMAKYDKLLWPKYVYVHLKMSKLNRRAYLK